MWHRPPPSPTHHRSIIKDRQNISRPDDASWIRREMLPLNQGSPVELFQFKSSDNKTIIKGACLDFFICLFFDFIYNEAHLPRSLITNFERNGSSGFHTKAFKKKVGLA